MKAFNIRKNIFLILGLIGLLVGALYFFLVEKDSQNNLSAQYQSNLQKNVIRELLTSDFELGQVIKQVNEKKFTSFEQLNINTKYPYFIFRNGQIAYWSDYRVVPKYEKLSHQEDVFFDNYFQNKGIFQRKSTIINKDTVEVFSLVNLYRFYQNQNDYLQSGYNSEIFHPAPLKISGNSFEKSQVINGFSGKPLFYFQGPEKDKIINSELPKTTLWIFVVALVFLGISAIQFIKSLLKQHQFGYAIILLFAVLIILRLLLLITGLPWIFLDQEVFNPSFYNGTILTPTLGDTVLNGLFIMIFMAVLALYYYRTRFLLLLNKTPPFIMSIISVLTVLVVMALAHICSNQIKDIYENSLYNLGYSMNLGFSKFKIISFVYYFFVLGNFFIGSHIAINLFLKLQPKNKLGFFHWLYGFLTGMILFYFITGLGLAFILAGIYFWIVYFFKLSRYFYTLRFQTLLYFILAAFFFALISVNTVEYQESKKNILDKNNFGKRYLAENDLLGEGLLDRFRQIVRNNESIVSAFQRKELAYESIKQQIKDDLLDMYFDKYDVEVKVFDANGSIMEPSDNTENIAELKSKVASLRSKTDLPNIFFINETGNSFIKQYITFNDVYNGSEKVGTVVLDLKLKDENVTSVYPELLLDKKFVQNPESKNYSYAIFDKNNSLVYNSGSFNYLMYFPLTELNGTEIYNSEKIIQGYSHFALKGQKDKKIIISQPNAYWKNLLSNFSFLFLISILGISALLLVFTVLNGFKSFSMNFSTKIQFYLNAAFLLPLIILIILTLSVVRTTLISIQEKSFIDNTKNIANTLQYHLENLQTGKSSRAYFESEINDLARNTKVDINLFDNRGKLNFTTRPLVYQYHLLSNYLNPTAYNKILEQKANELLTNESLGELNYKTVYIAVKGKENKNYGVVGIPFFDAKTMLDIQVKEVVATILIIFLLMFLILLVSSYFASSQLTSPLKLIAQRLKKTNLDKLDETIEWKSNDEIGLLTKSYNKMIKKLDESKIALSQSEKQTAWREMAKQVAHEIKNPLTPMKLSIQQLQRTLPMDDPKSRDRIQRALNSLTEQIDNISEIANSFSEFAKMPVPRNERFDLVPAVQKTVDLYSQNNNIKINFESSDKEIFVMGDRMLLNRVITNLILNGIQSVPPIRQPEIRVKVYKNEEENFGMIEVKDNGSGIAESIRKKVFIPNFSTKVGGSGLGLAMAKRGIEHAGGNIWFETVEGEGTTFFIDLPAN
ncbi:ATP-binding protein [Lacihabitans soyangensis]|uniref:histidine kinase n=1 Tax=Lacihabitans soyangensis TaxID=869394 RepID=A0AAE3KTU0_9BACT|nr:ATP-binding protein [Lacihabitans soyangensis]MCP9764393.1 HAMP domain-containing protein [Lacihabitans soyangensis]